MDDKDLVRRSLKVLLLHLASRSESPGAELQTIVQEVIAELHAEVKEGLKERRHLRVLGGPTGSDGVM